MNNLKILRIISAVFFVLSVIAALLKVFELYEGDAFNYMTSVGSAVSFVVFNAIINVDERLKALENK